MKKKILLSLLVVVSIYSCEKEFLDNDSKELIICDLKSRMKDLEIKCIQDENVLRDEIDLLKDKNNKHL